jgi:hypothetical protein
VTGVQTCALPISSKRQILLTTPLRPTKEQGKKVFEFLEVLK